MDFIEQALGFRVRGQQLEYVNKLLEHESEVVTVRSARPATMQEIAMWNLLNTPQSNWGAEVV